MSIFAIPSRHSAALAVALACALPMVAPAAPLAIDLSQYTLLNSYALPSVAAEEASAITYNWDTDSLFVLGDEGDALVEVSMTGVQLSVMTLTGFADTEGLTYVGGGRFVLTEERLRDAYRVTYVGGGTLDRAALPFADLGATVGNVGIEGISFDPRDGSFVTVKEVSAQEVNRNAITFGNPGVATVTSLFSPALGVADLSDVQVLAAVPSLAAGVDADNLLIFSQESRRLLEVDPHGAILSSFDFSSLASDAEGVTIDFDGNIYVVAETGPTLLVLSAPQPVPLPPSMALAASGLALLLTVNLFSLRASPGA